MIVYLKNHSNITASYCIINGCIISCLESSNILENNRQVKFHRCLKKIHNIQRLNKTLNTENSIQILFELMFKH